MAIFPGSAIPSAAEDYTIDYSCRFYLGWLSKTFAGAGNLDRWTVSCWLKNNGGLTSGTTGLNGIFYSQADNNDKTVIWNHGGSGPSFQNMYAGGTAEGYLEPSQKIRDPSSWYHFVFVWDSGNAAAGDRMRIWKNGVRITAFNNTADPPINQDSYINQAAAHQIGYYLAESGGQYYPDCYFADYYFLDGQAEDADAFGELSSTTNQWIPKDASGLTFGTNGFFLKFQDSSALGDDSSGNNNDFAVNSIDAYDQMLDTPTNNFPTWNPLCYSPWTSFSEGNLKNTGTSASYQGNTIVSMSPPTTGKWYFEFMCTVHGSGYPFTGTVDATVYEKVSSWKDAAGDPGDMTGSNGGWRINTDGAYETDGGGDTAGGQTPGTTDILQYALDHDNGALYYGINNTWYTPSASGGDPTSGASRTGAVMTWTAGARSFIPSLGNYNGAIMIMNAGQDSSFAGTKTSGSAAAQDANGKGDFYYAPPTNYLALCSGNLPDPDIALPEENFNTVLYAGNGSGGQTISGVGFAPDFTWIKNRGTAASHALVDGLRGTGSVRYDLESNSTSAQDTVSTDKVGVLNSDGFTLVGGSSQVNNSSYNYVSWNWKAGSAPTADNSAGAGATPTAGSVKIDGSNLGSALAGSIAATRLSANTETGFSIVEYSGVDTPSTNTIAHGLSKAPELYIIKNTTSVSPLGWIANTTVIDGTVDYLVLNTGAIAASQGSPWSTLPSASVFTLGANDGNTCNDGDDYVAYCFHSVEGYSQVGAYVGNGNTDGAFMYTGFRPAFILGKNTTEIDYSWWLVDTIRSPYNNVQKILSPQYNNPESDVSYEVVDIVSNGFKFRIPGTDGNLDTYNGNADGYLYIAFAESPFKYSNAR